MTDLLQSPSSETPTKDQPTPRDLSLASHLLPNTDQASCDTHIPFVGVGDCSTGTDHDICDTQASPVGAGTCSETPTNRASTPIVRASASHLPPNTDHVVGDTQMTSVGVGDSSAGTDQSHVGTHPRCVGAGVCSETPTSERLTPRGPASASHLLPNTDHVRRDAHRSVVGVGDSSTGTDQDNRDPQLVPVGAGVPTRWEIANADLFIAARTVEELMQPRIATTNRIHQLNHYGLPTQRAEAIRDELATVERHATLELEKAMKRHPLGPWVLAQKGVGLKTAGRLLAILGNPADRPNPAKLWAYCGYHVIDGAAPRRRKGEQANWNTNAKTLCYLIAEANIKNRSSAYRHVYDTARLKHADAVHTIDCPQCGICDGCGKAPGKNKQTHLEDTGCDDRRIRKAAAGDPLKDSHKHARAMRAVSKQFLLDLWKEARRIQALEASAPDGSP